jgi:hypothetical protein
MQVTHPKVGLVAVQGSVKVTAEVAKPMMR